VASSAPSRASPQEPTALRRAPWPVPAELALCEVNGYPLAYRDEGAGAAVVLLHGSFCDHRSWRRQVPALAARHRVIAPCLRHYHPEPWDGRGGDFTIEQHAADVAALIVSLGLPAVHLVGHSRGGAVALTVARRHPRLAATLTLADPRGLEPLLPDTPESRAMERELQLQFDVLRASLARGEVERAAREFVDALGGAGAWERRPPEERELFLDNLATAVDTGAAPAVAADDIARLEMPLLLITGERSPRRYGAMFAAMRACRRGIPEPVVIPAAAHAMQRENAERFNDVLLAFLAEAGHGATRVDA